MAFKSGPAQSRDDGFTLLEMVIAIALSAFVFLALGTTLAGGLRTLGVSKARAQGNEVATQAMEDLQRYPYGSLAICGSPIGVSGAPSGMDDPVISPSSSCPPGVGNPAKPRFGDQPCQTTPALTGIPAATYECVRLRRTYTVNRFVAWTDAGHSAKRFAVLVRWTDAVGTHTVTQQSSLRAPVTGDIIGVAPPSFDGNPTVSNHDPTIASAPGPLAPLSSIILAVVTKDLVDTTNDRVFASFTVVDPGGDLTTASFALTNPTLVSGSGSSARYRWTAQLNSTSGYTFPAGSQFFTFTAVRAIDGKTGAAIDPTRTLFCPVGGCSGTPTFTPSSALPQPATTIDIDSSGALKVGGLRLRAVTTLLGPEDRVQALIRTRSGLITVALAVDETQPCDPAPTATCVWVGALTASSGFAFNAGTQNVYFTAFEGQSNSSTSAASEALNFVIS